MARNIALLLPSEHRRLHELAHQVSHGRAALTTRQGLAGQLGAHLTAASLVLMRDLAPDPDARDAVGRLRETDERLAELAGEICSSDSEAARGRADEVLTLLAEHSQLEQGLVNDAATQLDVRRLRMIGGQFTRARDAQLREHAQLAPPVPRGLDLPAAALYEQARKVGLPGRSTMTRDELIAALSQDRRPVQA